jgi:hypothetical protein
MAKAVIKAAKNKLRLGKKAINKNLPSQLFGGRNEAFSQASHTLTLGLPQ